MKLDMSHWVLFAVLLVANGVLAFLPMACGLQSELLGGQQLPQELAEKPGWALGLANAAAVVVGYGLLGTIGLALGRRAGLPGVAATDAGTRELVLVPLGLGLAVGAVMVTVDQLLARSAAWPGFSHPAFPMSLLASGSAGIGEEIVFRGFVLSLCAFLATRVLGSREAGPATLWIANGMAGTLFIASHLPLTMRQLGVTSPMALPWTAVLDGVLLNGLVAIVAGHQYARSGLVAAMGVHFWADVVWHVLWPMLAGMA